MLGQAKAGLILDDHVQRGGIGGAELLEEERVHVLVDARRETQLQSVVAIDFQRLMQVSPTGSAAHRARVSACRVAPTPGE